MTETLRLSSPEDVATAIPYLLGFTPTDSIVAVGMLGGQIVMTARIDVDNREAYDTLLDVLDRNTDNHVLAIYGVAPMWLDASGPDSVLFPPDVAQSDRVAAEMTWRGLVARPSRQAVAELLRPLEPTAEGATAARQCASIKFRDEQWLAIEAATDLDTQAARWLGLARIAPAHTSAPLWFLTAWAMWRNGNGVQADICLSHCLDSDSNYSAALLLSATISAGVNPSTLPRLSAGDL